VRNEYEKLRPTDIRQLEEMMLAVSAKGGQLPTTLLRSMRSYKKLELEKDIERHASRWASANGWYVRKITSPSSRGIPDRLFVKDGRVVFIEFKARFTGKISPNQAREINLLRQHGAEVYVAKSVEEAVFALEVVPSLSSEDLEVDPTWLD
jgi:Holliday junction resolvase